MSAKAPGSLDGSWLANEDEEAEGHISWADDSDLSDPDEQLHSRRRRTPPKKQKPSPQQGRNARVIPVHSKDDFIMPSVDARTLLRNSPGARRQIQAGPAKPESRVVSRSSRIQSAPEDRRILQPVSNKIADMTIGTGEYLLDIIASTLKTLKKPISWVLAAYLFAGLLVLIQNLVTQSITSALSPICRIPGVSFLRLPICDSPYTSSEQPTAAVLSAAPANPEFDALMTIQGKFETVLEDSAAGVSLPLDMKRSETSIRDLRQVVRFSTIPSKNELLYEFDGFVETARIASYDLQKFNSHVGRAVDSVLSTARWTQRVLDDISYETLQSSSANSLISNVVGRLLAPFQPLQFAESRLLDQYITHSRLIANEIDSLIDEAQALLLVLTNLEDRLDIIHGISLRDNIAAQSSRDEILSQLWTFLGANRGKLDKVDNQLRLLGRVGEYRKLAYAHVAGTILKLQAMGTELEELRTRVGSAELARDRGLEEGVPLSMHIDNIRLGVERLEERREKAREVERSHVRRVIDKAAGVEERALLVDA